MAKEEKGKNYTLEPMISPYSNYPESLLKSLHMKWVIGPEGAIPEKDTEVSAMQIDPGTYYGAHVHPQPEIFIIASGKAEFEWGMRRSWERRAQWHIALRICRTPFE